MDDFSKKQLSDATRELEAELKKLSQHQQRFSQEMHNLGNEMNYFYNYLNQFHQTLESIKTRMKQGYHQLEAPVEPPAPPSVAQSRVEAPPGNAIPSRNPIDPHPHRA